MRVEDRPHRHDSQKGIAVVLAFAMITFCICTLIRVIATPDENLPYGMHPEPIVIFDDVVELDEIEVQTVEFEQEAPLISEDELIAKVVMAEAGTEPFVGKVAVAMVILNRADLNNESIHDVVTKPNQFAKPAYTVTEECYKAVAFARANRDLFPADMIYFRTKHYHKYGEPYAVIGNHYFNTEGG